jgi:hypothetical protein
MICICTLNLVQTWQLIRSRRLRIWPADAYLFVFVFVEYFVSPETKRIIRDEYVNTRIRSYSSNTNIRRFYSFIFALQPNLRRMRIFVWVRLYLARIERFDKVAKISDSIKVFNKIDIRTALMCLAYHNSPNPQQLIAWATIYGGNEVRKLLRTHSCSSQNVQCLDRW